MTSIAPLVSAFRSNTATPARAVSAEAAAPANAFADLLNIPAAPSGSPQDRAFTFAELGMFGRHGAQPLSGTGQSGQGLDGIEKQGRARGARPSGEQRSAVAERPVTPRQSDRRTVAADTEPEQQSARSSAMSRQAGGGDSALAAAGLLSGERLAATAQSDVEPSPLADGGGGAAPLVRRTSVNPGASPVSLVVSGSADALTVVARSQSESAEDRFKLRRLVEETAVEFGMHVAKFHLNGSTAESSFQSTIGGNHGARAR